MAQTKFLITGATGATGGEVDPRIVGRYLPAVVSNGWLDPAPTEAILRDARRTVATCVRSILGCKAESRSLFGLPSIRVSPQSAHDSNSASERGGRRRD